MLTQKRKILNKMFNMIPFVQKPATENKPYIVSKYMTPNEIKLKYKGMINTKYRTAVISREKINNRIGKQYK